MSPSNSTAPIPVADPTPDIDRVIAAIGKTDPHHPGCAGTGPERRMRPNSIAANAAHHSPNPIPIAATARPAVAPVKPGTFASVPAWSKRMRASPMMPAGAKGIHMDGAMAAGSDRAWQVVR